MNTVYETIPYGPNRVIVDSGGLGETPKRARLIYNIIPNVIFLRGDGWTLGAPTEYEGIAYNMWRTEWTHFVRKGSYEWIEIDRYGLTNKG